MPLDKTQGLRLSNDELLAHLLENDSNRIQLAERLPFFPINGDSLRVERASAAEYGADPVFQPDPSINPGEGVAIPTLALEVKYSLKLLSQDIIVTDFTAYNQSNVNSQVGVQLEAATRRMLYKFWKTFGIGDETANPQEFNGLRNLVTAGQTTTPATGTANQLTLIDLARLVGKIKSNNGRPHVLWCNPVAQRNILNAYFIAGLEPEYVMVNVPDSNGGMSQRPSLAFEGIPVYVDEFYPNTETVGAGSDGTSIYAMVLGRAGVYGIVPQNFGRKMIRVKEVLVAANCQTTYRIYWPISLVLEKQDALARLQLRPATNTT